MRQERRNKQNKFRREEDQDLHDAAQEMHEVAKEVHHPQQLLRPAKRIWVAVLFLLLATALAVSYALLQNYFTAYQFRACERANDVRRESNQRINAHTQDELNLLALLSALSHTHTIEISVWSDLNKLILKSTPSTQRKTKIFQQYEQDVNDLIAAYQDALSTDTLIHIEELKIHFDKLVIVDCHKATS